MDKALRQFREFDLLKRALNRQALKTKPKESFFVNSFYFSFKTPPLLIFPFKYHKKYSITLNINQANVFQFQAYLFLKKEEEVDVKKQTPDKLGVNDVIILNRCRGKRD